MERRDFETRLAPPDDAGVIAGYAAVWGKVDAYGDTLVRGAFAASLAAHKASGSRVLMLRGHDPSRPVGAWDSIVEDAKGLKVSGKLVLDSIDGRDAFALMRGDALDGLSIGFRTTKSTPLPGGGRRVEAMNLIEISLVTLPAQSAARITSVRSTADAAGLAAFINAQTAKLKGKS
jgi:HK97 family phage prohead protease